MKRILGTYRPVLVLPPVSQDVGREFLFKDVAKVPQSWPDRLIVHPTFVVHWNLSRFQRFVEDLVSKVD